MRSESIAIWVQTITSLAVIVGLALVILELKQASDIAKAQLTSDSFALNAVHGTSLYGESAADVIAKACLAPGDLTDGEIVVATAIYNQVVQPYRRMQIIEQRSGLYEGDWKVYGKGAIQWILKTPVGRFWFEERFPADSEFGKFAKEILESMDEPNCDEFYESFRARFDGGT